jgi:hypothetical protein
VGTTGSTVFTSTDDVTWTPTTTTVSDLTGIARWYYVDRSSHTERRRMAFGYLPR